MRARYVEEFTLMIDLPHEGRITVEASLSVQLDRVVSP